MLKHLIDRPVGVSMMLAALVVTGISLATRLPVSLLPEGDVPRITVQVEAPAMSSRELEESVAAPLRNHLRQIDGLAGIESLSKDGSTRIRLAFSHSDNMDYRFIEVNEKVDRAMGSLAAGISRPKVVKAGASDIPAFYVNVTGSGDFLQTSSFVREVIVRRLEQLEEVAMVDASGFEEPEIMIVPDPARTGKAGISMTELAALVESADIRLGSLTIRDGLYRYGVRFQSNASSLQDIENLWINHDGRLLRLGDLASVSMQSAPRTGIVESDGVPAVNLAVIKRSDARMSDLRRAVQDLMTSFESDYPSMSFEIVRDQTALLDYSINSLIQNIIAAILLACLVIFLFMRDFRSPVLVAVTIPVSLVFSMLLFWVMGMSLNIISLSGLLLGVGMLTDNTLILVDNITGRWGRGEPLRDAVLQGTREVAAPMLSSILTTCAVFVPLVGISGMAGAMFRDQALAVAIVLFTSWAITITAVPVYYWQLYKKLPAFRPHPLLERIPVSAVLECFDHRGNSWMLRHRWVAWTLVGGGVVGAVLCFAFMPKATLPEMTRTDMLMKVDWNKGITPEENISRCRTLSAAVSPLQTTAMAGVQQFVLGHSGDTGPEEALVYMAFDGASSLSSAESALADMIAARWPEAAFSFEPSGNVFDLMFGADETTLVARLRSHGSEGPQVAELRECTAALREALPRVDIAPVPVKEQIVFAADPELMALYGVSYTNMMSSLRSVLGSYKLLSIVQGDRSVPVVMGREKGALQGLIENTYIHVKDADIPLSALMRRTTSEDLRTIVAGTEGEYYPVGLDVPHSQVGSTMLAVRECVRDFFDVSFSGSWQETDAMLRDLGFTIAIAILLLFLILAAQFESLLQPLLILLEIVVDICFALGALWLCGGTINLMSLIGLVVIIGIVINDSILKIDTINRLRRSGMEVDEAVMTAGSRRVKAIVMTSLTTILAVCPFLVRGNMGADLQFPMTVVIIAGMAVGTLVSLFIIPALYSTVYKRLS